jgi:hypothetical protein
VKVHHPAARFDVQFVTSDDKLDGVGIFLLICDRLPVKSLAHITPAQHSAHGAIFCAADSAI